MSKKVEEFPFYITYADVSAYCSLLADKYAKNVALVDVIDSNKFVEQCDNPQKYKKNADGLLLAIRQCLVDNGFETEVSTCDKVFADGNRNRSKVNPYVPLNERGKTKKYRKVAAKHPAPRKVLF